MPYLSMYLLVYQLCNGTSAASVACGVWLSSAMKMWHS